MVIILPSHKANYEFSFYRIFAIIHEVRQKVTHPPKRENSSSKKVSQKVEHLLENDANKWSTFKKVAPKSDALSDDR